MKKIILNLLSLTLVLCFTLSVNAEEKTLGTNVTDTQQITEENNQQSSTVVNSQMSSNSSNNTEEMTSTQTTNQEVVLNPNLDGGTEGVINPSEPTVTPEEKLIVGEVQNVQDSEVTLRNWSSSDIYFDTLENAINYINSNDQSYFDLVLNKDIVLENTIFIKGKYVEIHCEPTRGYNIKGTKSAISYPLFQLDNARLGFNFLSIDAGESNSSIVDAKNNSKVSIGSIYATTTKSKVSNVVLNVENSEVTSAGHYGIGPNTEFAFNLLGNSKLEMLYYGGVDDNVVYKLYDENIPFINADKTVVITGVKDNGDNIGYFNPNRFIVEEKSEKVLYKFNLEECIKEVAKSNNIDFKDMKIIYDSIVPGQFEGYMFADNFITEITSQMANKENLNKDVVTALEGNIEQAGLNIGDYYDVKIEIKDYDNVIGNISEPTDKITTELSLSEELKNIPDNVNRTYSVYSYHDGKVYNWDNEVTIEGNLKVFSDKFSTYVVAYKDVLKPVVTPEISVKPNVPTEDNKESNVSGCKSWQDKNCDGVVSCDEIHGKGWEWSNEKNACVFKGNNDQYQLVNTGV